jgi:hypothetical protein
MMHPYKYIEKLTVLQHPDTKDIVRLMIEHDGQQTYGLQRSIVTQGKTRHFYNKKLWHSAYNIKLELGRRVSDYEDKGFEVMTEISLRPSQVPDAPEFSFSTNQIESYVSARPINATDVPIFVDCSFHQLSIQDLRYNTEILDEDITQFFNGLRKAIELLPFAMVAVWSGNSIQVLSLEFRSKPQPKHAINYLSKLAAKKNSAFSIIDGTMPGATDLGPLDEPQSFAVLTGKSLCFHLASTWKVANVFLEKHPHASLFTLYGMDSDKFTKIQNDIPLNPVKRSGNAQILFTRLHNQISNVTFVRSLGFDAQLATLNEFN